MCERPGYAQQFIASNEWAKIAVKSKCGNYWVCKSTGYFGLKLIRYLFLDRNGCVIKSNEFNPYYVVTLMDDFMKVNLL